VAATSLAIMGQTWWAIDQDKKQTIAAETTNGLVAARLLEEHASQTLQDAVHTLDQVTREVRTQLSSGPTNAERIRNVVAMHKLTNSRHLKALQYVEPDGMSWVSSPDYPSHQNQAISRGEIQFLLKQPDHQTALVGHPYASPYDSQWVIPVARTLFDAKDRPLGVISVDIRLSYFGTLYARIAKENNASVALLSDEGFVIVRSPFEARYVDRDITEHSALANLLGSAAEGSFSDSSFLDDDDGLKLYTFHKIRGFPVTTVYAREYESVLSPWKDRSKDRILFTATVVVLTFALTVFLLVYIRRLQRSQQSLRDSEYRFEGLFQHSPMPSILMRPGDARYVEANSAWLDHFGYTRAEVIGHTAMELGLWESPHARLAMVEELQKNQRLERFEVRHKHKNGHVFVCLLSARYFQAGTESMIVFTQQDVTQQRAVEQEIREMNLLLEERVHARTEKLEIANRELEQALASVQAMQAELVRSEKMAALGSLVAGVAHELNTPIGNSVTVGSTLQHQISSMTTEFRQGTMRRSALENFLSAATHGTEILMRSLLRADQLISSFKRVAVDQSSDLRRSFDLQTVLTEVCLTLEPMHKNTPFGLSLDLVDDIQMDSFPGALGQLITNFVSNALQHGFEGRSNGHMQLHAHVSGPKTVTIRFSDDGIGMTEDTRKRVFDPFFTTKLGQGGSGLGMNIVYNIVHEVLGGTIDIVTTLGSGVTITVTIPRIAPQQENS
jgi:PAS domain S-box-containing protein